MVERREKNRSGLREGFVMKHVIVLLTFVLGIFALLQTYLKSHAQEEDLEKENLIYEKELETAGEIFFYEIGMLESYAMNGNMTAIESYFYESEDGERIYEDYEYLEKLQDGFQSSPDMGESRGRKSLGGYGISYMNPPLGNLRESRWDMVSFKVAKELEVIQRDSSIFKIKIESEVVKSACMVERAKRKVSCDPLEKISGLNAVGEEVKERE